MKSRLFLFLIAFKIVTLQGQSVNPVFFKELISEEKFDNFELTSNYYCISKNISNKNSFVYVSDNPSVKAYIKFSTQYPSYVFSVHKGTKIIYTIMLLQQNIGDKQGFTYRFIDSLDRSTHEPCNIQGDITEYRARELVKLKVDSAKITSNSGASGKEGEVLSFDSNMYVLQSYSKMKEELIVIVKQLMTPPHTEIKDTIDYIKKQTIGGALDYHKALESESQSLFIYEGMAYNKQQYAILLWGLKVKMLRISSAKKARKLWEGIYKRKMTKPEKRALEKAFEKKGK